MEAEKARAERLATDRMVRGLDLFGRNAEQQRADLVAALRRTRELVGQGWSLADAYREAADEFRSYDALRRALGIGWGQQVRVREDRRVAAQMVEDALKAMGQTVRRRGPVVTTGPRSAAEVERIRAIVARGAQ